MNLMLFEKIYQNSDLFSMVRSYCDENSIEVCLSPNLEAKSHEKLLILKPDDYYSSQNIHNPPPAIDCIMVVKCDESECYDMYLVELRNTKSSQGFEIKNIEAKFRTIVDDFLLNKFVDIFGEENYCKLKCYFVSDPYSCNGMSDEEYQKKIKAQGLKLESFNSLKPFKFKNRLAMIEPKLPNPMIDEC